MQTPEKIELRNQKLTIAWSDATMVEIPVANLRRWCPCATCADERMQESKHFIPIYSAEQTTIKKIVPVGSYAISIIWQDGHSTGMYEFEKLSLFANAGGGITV